MNYIKERWEVLSLTLTKVRDDAQSKQYLIEWIGTVLGELPRELISTCDVNLNDALKDGKIIYSLILAFIANSPKYRDTSVCFPSSFSAQIGDSYWDKCIELCRRTHVESGLVESIKRSVDGDENVLVRNTISQLCSICERFDIGDELYITRGDNSTFDGAESLRDTIILPKVVHNDAKSDNVCAACGCDITSCKRVSKVGDGSFPVTIGVTCPWSKLMCFKCYQKNRKNCISKSLCRSDSSDDDGSPKIKKAKYMCECGAKFVTVQKKASHCRVCKTHKESKPAFSSPKK